MVVLLEIRSANHYAKTGPGLGVRVKIEIFGRSETADDTRNRPTTTHPPTCGPSLSLDWVPQGVDGDTTDHRVRHPTLESTQIAWDQVAILMQIATVERVVFATLAGGNHGSSDDRDSSSKMVEHESARALQRPAELR
jgi:hypothetical protein